MSATMIVIVLLAWTVAGLLVAVVFGSMIQASHTSLEDDDALPASNDSLRYFRRHQRKPSSATRVRHGTAKRMTG